MLKNGTDIGISTVLCHLSKEFGLKFCKPAAKQHVTSVMKKKRLFFTDKHFHGTIKKWETFLFFDESTVQQFAVQKRHVYGPKWQRFNTKYIISTVKPSGLGAMSKNGTAGLYFLAPDLTIKGLKYVQLLQE